MLFAVFAICALIVSVVGDGAGDVVFSAAINDDRSYQTNETVKYDTIFTNIGNGYNKHTGIFTPPRSGLYVFHIHGMSLRNTGFWFTLYHNDEPLIRAHGGETSVYHMGGNSVAVTAQSGDAIFVKVLFPSSVHGSSVNRYTTFTGYLLKTSGEACQ